MKTVTSEQVYFFLSLFSIIFVYIQFAISLLVVFLECETPFDYKRTKDIEGDIECLFFSLIFIFQIFVIVYIGINDQKITKTFVDYINQGKISSDVFLYFLIALIEILIFFSMVFYTLVFDKGKNS